MTLCLHNQRLDPYFNLAAEEHLLQTTEQNVFMLWRNEPSIIIGRNQNAYSEINLDFVEAEDIKVVRRLSGGGAVFHDLGNINFTFIVIEPAGPKLDFQRYTDPIIAALAELGVEAKFEGRNDLTIQGRKISGNAQHIYKDRVLHHGTLLYSSVLHDLNQALKVNAAKFEDKAVKSVRSRVTNIAEHLSEAPPVGQFIDLIMNHMRSQFPSSSDYEWTDQDLEAIQELKRQKYATWEWNFGRSPKYSFINTVRTPAGTLEVHLDIKEGTIRGARLFGDYFGARDISDVEAALIGTRHERRTVRQKLAAFDLEQYVSGISLDKLVDSLF